MGDRVEGAERSLQVLRDRDQVAQALGECLARAYARYLQEGESGRRPFQVAVSGGSLPPLLRAALEGMRGAGDGFSCENTCWLLVDERLVPSAHVDSNYGALREALAGLVDAARIVGIDEARIPHGAAAVAAAYQTSLGQQGVSPETVDAVLLGMGEDGHTASLFPGHEEARRWDSLKRWVIGVTDSPKPPPQRITLTLDAIDAAHSRVFVVTGAGKADAVQHIFAEGNRRRLPAGLVGDAQWLLDTAAASRLPS